MHQLDQILVQLRTLETQKAAVDGEVDELKTQLKTILEAQGVTDYDGAAGKVSYRENKPKITIDYRAVANEIGVPDDVLEAHVERVYDWEAIANALDPPDGLVERHTKVTPGARPLRITYR